MKVVTARATSVTGCEQSFDEAVGWRLHWARPAEAQAVQGEDRSERSGGMCWSSCTAMLMKESRATASTTTGRTNECGKQKGIRQSATPAKQTVNTHEPGCLRAKGSLEAPGLHADRAGIPLCVLKSGCGCAPSG